MSFVYFTATMTGADGESRKEVIVVLSALGDLQPGQQILVHYGPHYLEGFDERKRRAASDRSARPAIKDEPRS